MFQVALTEPIEKPVGCLALVEQHVGQVRDSLVGLQLFVGLAQEQIEASLSVLEEGPDRCNVCHDDTITEWWDLVNNFLQIN